MSLRRLNDRIHILCDRWPVSYRRRAFFHCVLQYFRFARDSGAIAWISDEIGLQRESPLVSRVREVRRARLARH
jgi:hypothetical protein